MKHSKTLSRIYQSAKKISFDDSQKLVIMSDVHRGDGSWADDFSKNQNIFFTAMRYYFEEGYTYIENGDGDELWKFKKLTDIIEFHKDVFWILSEFYKDGRLYLVFGNHDMDKRDENYLRDNMYTTFNRRVNKYISLLNRVKVHEGLVFIHKNTGQKIFIVHGHQVDFMSSTIWRVTRLLVRYLWKPLELFGANDPTSTAKNYRKKEKVEKRLTRWVLQNDCMLLTGHTHRPMLPELGEPLYFNHGSSVHPRCITGLEVVKGEILLIKWSVKTKDDGTLYIGRELLAGPNKISDYINGSK